MDLGIAGKKALITAASKGLGRACAMALAAEGVDVTITARNAGPLEDTAEKIRQSTGVTVNTVVADIATEDGRDMTLAACPGPDILVNNAGGPPTGDFRDWDRDVWMAALDANMLGPIFMIKATVDAMIERKFGRIVNITSSAVKAPIEILGLSNGARSGLTGFCAGLARKTVAHNVTLNAILPGPFDTDRLKSNLQVAATTTGKSMGEIRTQRRAANPAGRFGEPSEFGQLCAFICSVQAGYITGQNLLIDGGGYPGTF